MSAFPATALLPKQYSRLCTSWTKNSDGNVAGPIFEELSTVLHGVDYHTSVPRVKGGPKYLPETYQIRTVFAPVDTLITRSAAYSKYYHQELRSTTWGFTSIPSDWLWSDSGLQAPDTIKTVKARLYLKTMDKIKGDQANLSVDAFEAKETIKLLRDLTSIKRAADRFKREMSIKTTKRSKRQYVIVYDDNGNPTKQRRYFDTDGSRKRVIRARTSKSGSGVDLVYSDVDYNVGGKAAYFRDQWMQARFGIRPLIGSIFDTMKAMLNNRLNGKFTTRCTSTIKSELKKTQGLGTYESPLVTYKVFQDTRGVMISQWSFPPNQPFIQDFLSLNPIGIAWELLPLSWMADYFVNVGQTLQNWEDWFRFNSAYVGGMTTVVTREVRDVSSAGQTDYAIRYWPNGNPQDGVHSRREFGRSFCKVTRKERVIHSTLPAPGGLTAKVDLSAAKVLDVCSVISQILKSHG